jgi:hypothetical protein
MKDIYTLKALEKFECTGSDCPRSCCEASWYFAVDSSTVEKWENVDNVSDRKWLLDAISDVKIDNEAQLKIKEDKSCYFFNIDKLCDIQVRYGHDYLPCVCREFPRVSVNTPNSMYKTASFSCPEIVRLVLSDGLEKDLYVKSQLNEKSFGILDNNAQLHYHLDRFFNYVLDLEKYPLGVRVFYLANLFGELFNQAGQLSISVSQVNQLIKATKGNLYDINLAVKQGKLKPDSVTAGSFWKVVYSLGQSRQLDPVFLEDESSPLTKIINESGDLHEDFDKIYEVIKGYIDASRPYIRQNYGKLLQIYIKVYFSGQGFPLVARGKKTNIVLVECMIGLCLLHLLLWMQLHSRGSITNNFLQELIVEVSRKYSHSGTVSERLEEDSHMQQIERYSVCFLDLF